MKGVRRINQQIIQQKITFHLHLRDYHYFRRTSPLLLCQDTILNYAFQDPSCLRVCLVNESNTIHIHISLYRMNDQTGVCVFPYSNTIQNSKQSCYA